MLIVQKLVLGLLKPIQQGNRPLSKLPRHVKTFPNFYFKNMYTSLAEFYPYYLSEHRNATSRALHFVGTGLVIALLLYAVCTMRFSLLWFVPLVGYGFAWVGHFFFEKNKPATFKYPFFSLASDFILFKDILTGQLAVKMEKVDVLYPV